MANTEHLEILMQGVEDWNAWREDHAEVVPDLAGASLEGADISEANLSFAKLRRVNLHEAKLGGSDLRGARLSWADLSWADLSEADLRGAFFSEADLSGAYLLAANLSGALLDFADLTGAHLNGTNFTDARAQATQFGDVDLSVARGLETVIHDGPSTIGIDTIYKSHGKIPDAFLRGCGVPDEFIDFIRSMTRRAIEFYSCFISYSTHDQEFAERLHADLQARGVRCWFAPHDLHYGKKIHEQIDEAIRLHDKLLLILSEHSMSSAWVGEEIARARKREAQEKRQMLFPVGLAPFDPAIKEWECFDADRGKDSAREIREYPIPDFSRWDTDNRAYQTEFGKLVRDLKAVGSG